MRPTREDLPDLFPEDQRLNVGLLLGEPSGGLVDVDLDSIEAVRVQQGESVPAALGRSALDEFLTSAVFEGLHPFQRQLGDVAWRRVAKGIASGMTASEVASYLGAVANWDQAKAGPLYRLTTAKTDDERRAAFQDVTAQLVAMGGAQGLLNIRGQAAQRATELQR
jgi:hypothetical protein